MRLDRQLQRSSWSLGPSDESTWASSQPLDLKQLVINKTLTKLLLTTRFVCIIPCTFAGWQLARPLFHPPAPEKERKARQQLKKKRTKGRKAHRKISEITEGAEPGPESNAYAFQNPEFRSLRQVTLQFLTYAWFTLEGRMIEIFAARNTNGLIPLLSTPQVLPLWLRLATGTHRPPWIEQRMLPARMAMSSRRARRSKRRPRAWCLCRELGNRICEKTVISTPSPRHPRSCCDVLHGDSASNAAAVSFWAGASYLMPVVGAAIADSCWGKYKTVLVGLSISLAGMVVITTSATLPSLRPPPCEHGAGTHCAPAALHQRLVFFAGIYLCAIGFGGAKAAIVSFGAEQFDDESGKNVAERERKASYFSWYYGVGNLGMLTSGTLLVWVQDKVSWGLGYGVCASFVAAAVVGLAATASVYRLVPPAGSPLKGACQVLVAFARKANVRVPDSAAELYAEEHVKASLLQPPRESLEHTDQFRWLDKASVVTSADLEDGNPWRLCTVTQVEEVKTLLRLIPIWLTSAVYFVANTQAQTTFVQQGTMTDSRIGRGAFSFPVPAASLTCIETVFVVASIALYNRAAAAPAARRFFGRAEAFTPLQLMGLGHGAVVAAVALAACAEARRLANVRAGAAPLGIAWLLPQYVAMAVSDASLSVGQLEFFYDQAPETVRGASTAFYFLSCSLGNLLSSQLVTLVATLTATGGRTGWFPPNMDDGHLDYYFMLIVGINAVNFAVFVCLAKGYTPKRVR